MEPTMIWSAKRGRVGRIARKRGDRPNLNLMGDWCSNEILTRKPEIFRAQTESDILKEYYLRRTKLKPIEESYLLTTGLLMGDPTFTIFNADPIFNDRSPEGS